MPSRLLFVSGAPGSGKSTIAPLAASRASGRAVVFDMDELLDRDGALLGVRIATPESSEVWGQYNELWVRLVALVLRSDLPVVLLGPLTSGEVEAADPGGELQVRFAHLDCSDGARTLRLQARGWGKHDIDEALADAAQLRREIPDRISSEGDLAEAARELLSRIVRVVPG